ncbi:hypothetical protein ABIA69_001936 [Lysinibacillus parviboronicapiens]|uniref:Uncharacterized protein n=1 Tax=Lysinibacillus parviboronicapiens TaxID=436516 RepID=A0ABV2PIK6_9BACI
MKARLNILGRKHNIVSVEVEDAVTGERKHIYDSEFYSYMPEEQKVNLAECIESPLIAEERTKLIQHLDDMQQEEHNKLVDILTEMGELEEELPFDYLGKKLIAGQREYKLAQQRVFGIIDAVEEVKAFTEGYYLNVDDEADEAKSSH